MIDSDFPLWLRLNHFVNFLFLTMLMRSGIQILAERPKLYWNDSCAPGSEWLKLSKGGSRASEGSDQPLQQINSVMALPGGPSERGLELGRSWHFLSLVFWVTNGLTYVTLLFVTGEWKRLIPTSFDIFPQALHVFMQYATFHLPTPPAGSVYDPLQQLAYGTVVFIMAPMSIMTGAAMSTAFANKFPWYPRLFGGRQAARSIHFLVLLGYIVFVTMHVTFVVINDFPACMNHITLGINSHHREGLLLGVAGILFVLGVHIVATKWSLSSPQAVKKIIDKLPHRLMKLAYGQNFIAEPALEADSVASDEALRIKIYKMLTEDGLETMLEPFPENDVEFEAIRQQLRELPIDDLEQKLVISGFAAYPINDQRCFECMYYLVNRKWCDIPELELPVEEEWWCRLWRI